MAPVLLREETIYISWADPDGQEDIMGRVMRTLGPSATIAGALVLWLATVATVPTAAARQNGNGKAVAKAAVKPAPAVAAQAGDYVGEETCLTCHEDRKKGYHGSPHSRARDPRTPAAKQGCESCHGPGKAHVDGGGDKEKIKRLSLMTPSQVSETCTACHNRSEHDNWGGSKHESRKVACTTCHTVHAPKSEKTLLKTTTVTETCEQCHRKEVNKLHKTGHMPVREGKLECTTCHNPHGSQNVKLLREGNSINEACTSCHAEKRGPFLWDHVPVREGCTTCHDPHGSNNDRMLVAKVPMLCQRCHIHSRHPATIYDATQVNVSKSNRVVGRSCVNCHTMIHGSNHPNSGKVFVR